MAMTMVGVVRETGAGERRVALTPDGVGRLRPAGVSVLIEPGAGACAGFSDGSYAAAGASVVSREDVFLEADVLLCVQPPSDVDHLRPGQILVGQLEPLLHPDFMGLLAEAKVTAISIDMLPRRLSRAQSMDALTSQANVAGYKAVLVAANAYGGYFPMLMTAAGTTRPARVLVIGAGVAGLQAIATARRLGAMVTGYDIRDAARSEIMSTGAAFLDLGPAVSAAQADGYARALSAEESQAQRQALEIAVAAFDVVITTAQVQGGRPPLLIGHSALAGMRPGSVVVDLAAGPFGGNVATSKQGAVNVTGNGVTVIGAGNLAAEVPHAASTAYSRNMTALLTYLVRDGVVTLDPADEVQAGILVAHDGEIVHPRVIAALARAQERVPS